MISLLCKNGLGFSGKMYKDRMKINGQDFHVVVLLFLSKKKMFQVKIWKSNTKNEACSMTDGISEKEAKKD